MTAYPAPFDPTKFPAIPDPVYGPPPDSSQPLSAQIPVMVSSALRLPSAPEAIVSALTIAARAGQTPKSQSFHNHDPGSDPPLDARQHFHFLPGIDKVDIRWIVDDPDEASAARLELWSAADPTAPVWTHDVADVAAELLPWESVVIAGDPVRFPDQCPNVAFAPYQLRLTVTSKNGTITTAHTYFDILVAKLEIQWGTRPQIPAAAIGGVLPLYWPMTQADERQLLDDLRVSGLEVARHGRITLPLRSTQAAYIHCAEWYCWRDMAYQRHLGRWGDGPRIPLLAKIWLKTMAGKRVHSAAAARLLGPARFLWDWHDKDEAMRRDDMTRDHHATARTFVMTALKYDENVADEPPHSLNCHVDRGGKRGGAARVLPDTAASVNFPFDVTAAPTRKWAALSTAATAGPYACYTGVLFQPSRIALDSYRLRVMLAAPLKDDRSGPSVDDPAPIDTLLAAHAGLPVAKTGYFEVKRRIDVKYVRKSADTTAMDLTVVDRVYRPGGIEFEWTHAFWTPVHYRARFAESMNPDNLNIDANPVRDRRFGQGFVKRAQNIVAYHATRASLHFTTYDHWSGLANAQRTDHANQAQLTLPGRDIVLGRLLAAQLPAYINKARKINDKQRKWNKIVQRYPLASVEEQSLRFYREALSDAERVKLNGALKVAYNHEGWMGWDVAADNPVDWGNANYNYTYGFGDFFQELHQRQVMAEVFQGTVFFHYTHMYETVKFDGSVEARQCDLGGLAAVGTSSDLGLKAALLVWDHPDNMQRQALNHAQMQRAANFDPLVLQQPANQFMNGNYTAAHEIGHFMHLPHDQPTADKAMEWDLHDSNDRKCIMNYDHDGLHLCGACALRLRGWARFQHGPVDGFSQANPAVAGAAPPPLGGPLAATFATVFPDFV